MKLKTQFPYCWKFKDRSNIELMSLSYIGSGIIEYKIPNYNLIGFKSKSDFRRQTEFIKYLI